LQEAMAASLANVEEDFELQQALAASLADTSSSTAPSQVTPQPVPPSAVGAFFCEDFEGVPADLQSLLRKLNPSIVSDIMWTAGSTPKIQFLQACLSQQANAADELAPALKVRKQQLWQSLSDRDRRDLLLAFELGEGHQNRFFLECVEDDRRQHQKLGDLAVCHSESALVREQHHNDCEPLVGIHSGITLEEFVAKHMPVERTCRPISGTFGGNPRLSPTRASSSSRPEGWHRVQDAPLEVHRSPQCVWREPEWHGLGTVASGPSRQAAHADYGLSVSLDTGLSAWPSLAPQSPNGPGFPYVDVRSQYPQLHRESPQAWGDRLPDGYRSFLDRPYGSTPRRRPHSATSARRWT